MAAPTHGPFAGAYLASITVENIRCFADTQRLDLCAPTGNPARWTLLLGENGTGKTTLLQAIAAAALNPIELHPDRSSEGVFTPGGFPERPPQHRGVGPAILETSIEAVLMLKPSLTGTPKREVTTSIRLRDPGYGLRDEFSFEAYELESPAFVSSWFGYGPLRRPGSGKLSSRPPNPLAAVFGGEASLVNAEEWYLQRDYAAANPRLDDAARVRARQTRDRLDALVRAVLPDVEELTPTQIPATEIGQFRLVAKTPYGEVPITDLGLGYQTTLAWVVDLAARMMAAYPESENPLAEPAVVLIDEIDLHLHPTWQRTLLRELSLRFPNVQFIATAHSPLIVQAAPDANVAVLRREGDRVIIDQQPRDVRNWRIDQILTSDLFGLPSARTVALDEPLARRDALLAKSTLTADDERELAQLRTQIGEMPGGETPWEMKAMEVIRRAALSLEDRPGVRDAVNPSATPSAKKTGAKGAARKKPSTAKPTRRTR